jgi:hypothetical protein
MTFKQGSDQIDFDTISRNKVLECLTQYNIPVKLQKRIALTLTGTNAIVKINNEFPDKFDVQTGVKQGDPLSGTLFSIAMDAILKKMEQREHLDQTETMQRLCR